MGNCRGMALSSKTPTEVCFLYIFLFIAYQLVCLLYLPSKLVQSSWCSPLPRPYSISHSFSRETHPTPRGLIIICPTFPISYSIKKKQQLYLCNIFLEVARISQAIGGGILPSDFFMGILPCFCSQIYPSHSQLFPPPQALPGPILGQSLQRLNPRKQGRSICWSDHLGARHCIFVRT